MKTSKRRIKAISALSGIFLIVFLFSSCLKAGLENNPQAPAMQTVAAESSDSENSETMRGFWIDYLEIGELYSQGEEAFVREIDSSFDYLAQKGFNTVFFHARAFCDAFYRSAIFPVSSYLNNGAVLSVDPLAVAVEAAHRRGMRIHAWVNPYRVSYNNDIDSQELSSTAKQMLENGQANRFLITGSGIYLDPANIDNQSLILGGIKEILDAYAVDGIHIDDYFYPADVTDTDRAGYEAYLSAGGTLSLSDWRRANVSALVSSIYGLVKTYGAEKEFGVSPSGNFETNYNTCYADIERWVKQAGYCDYIVPQLYYGFLHESCSFEELLDRWCGLTDGSGVRLSVGLALYKAGKTDPYAGAQAAREEWIASDDLIARQIRVSRDRTQYGGFVVFSYADLMYHGTEGAKIHQLENLFSLMNEESPNG